MWIQAILSGDDLRDLLMQLSPLTIEIGGPEQYIAFHDVEGVALVPDRGLRLTCKANVRWPVFGLTLPANVHALTALLSPIIEKRAEGDVLTFGITLEKADFVGVPTMVDEKITERINAEIAKHGIQGRWNFTETLTRTVPLPGKLRPLEALRLAVAWGEVKITEEALVLAVSFHPTVYRADRGVRAALDGPLPSPSAAPLAAVASSALRARPQSGIGAGLTPTESSVVVGTLGLAIAAIAYGVGHAMARRRPWWKRA